MTKFDYPAHTDPRLMDGQGRDDLISVSAIFKSLWRNAWIVALCTAIGIALAYHYAFNVAEQTYRATASVVLETGDQAFISFDETSGQLSGEVVSLNTQVGVLRGFDLLGRVVEELRLDEDPEFNPLLNIEGDQPAETSPERAQIGRELAVRLLRVQTDVRNLPNSLIFEIAVTTTDPVKSMNIANTIAEMYILEQVERKVEATEQATNWLLNRVSELQIELEEAEARVDNFRFESSAPQPESSVDLERLTSEAQAVRTVYRYLLTRLQETMAQQGLHRPDSRVLSSAMLPLSPNAPQRVLLLVVGAVAGFFLSLVVVFIREAVDKKIWSAEQIEKITGVPMIGGLPLVRSGTIDREIRGGSGTQSSLHRAMESLITTLLMSRIGKQPHVLVIASARPGEGKTTVAMALARLMSERGRKTLLVDADIRKAKLSKNLGYRKAGVLAAFSGEADIAETIDHHEALGVDVLGGKPSTTHRGTVQEASTIERFFSTLRSSYDVVVVDTSPLRAVADALPICKAADTVLMLSSWKETRTEDLRAGMRMLSKVDIDPAGYVMTKMPESELAHSAYDGY